MDFWSAIAQEANTDIEESGLGQLGKLLPMVLVNVFGRMPTQNLKQASLSDMSDKLLKI